MSGVLRAQLAHAVVVAFLVVLQLLGGSEADAPPSGDRTTPRERERGQSRVWVPEDQLTLPVGWSWEQYSEGLLAKELGKFRWVRSTWVQSCHRPSLSGQNHMEIAVEYVWYVRPWVAMQMNELELSYCQRAGAGAHTTRTRR
jgi:hypothetical protein